MLAGAWRHDGWLEPTRKSGGGRSGPQIANSREENVARDFEMELPY